MYAFYQYAKQSAIDSYKTWHPFQQESLFSRYGKCWAVVTGGTGDIGMAFCRELAKSGFDICIIARNEEKLRKAAKEIESEFGVNTRMIKADFRYCYEPGFFEEIQRQLQDLDVGILVHSAAKAYSGLFMKESTQECQDIVLTNTLPVVMLTKMLLPKLTSRNKRSAIVSMSSTIGQLAVPGASVYAATKSFIHTFTVSLADEVIGKVDVLSMTPHAVMTKMTKELSKGKFIIPWNWLAITPETCVKKGLRQLGKKKETNVDWRHSLVYYMRMLTPDFIKSLATLFINLDHDKNTQELKTETEYRPEE